MRLLIVTFSYAPALSPRAFRWTALAEAWAADGHEVTVISSSRPDAPHQETLNGVQVHRVGTRLRSGRYSADAALPAPWTIEGAMIGTLKFGYRLILRRFVGPDPGRFFQAPAVRLAQDICRAAAPDAIITVSSPLTPHLVGLELKQSVGAKWLVDMGDPLTPSASSQADQPANCGRIRDIRSEVLRCADTIAVTNEGARTACDALFAQASSKAAVVPPLLSSAVPNETERFFPSDSVFRLVYTGRFYRELRSPSALLALFAGLRRQPGFENAELHILGQLRDCASLFPKTISRERVHVHGMLSREDALRAQNEASALVNLGNDSSNQLPSKVVEYAATGLPILNLVCRDGDLSASFFEGYPNALTVLTAPGGGSESDAARVADFLRNARRIEDRSVLDTFLQPYRLPAVSESYLRLLS